MKIIFMGTPGFASDILKAILESKEHEVLAVYTQPDRPAGRGQKLKLSPVKELALSYNIPVYQPLNFKELADRDTLATFGATVFIVAAYGLILPQPVLDMPKYGCINVHASLLPKWRGAAPIQRSIMAGENITGITIMQMEAGLDTGPILLQRALGIGMSDTSETLHNELANLGGKLLLDALARLQNGTLHAISQDDSKASYAHKLSKQDGAIDFNQPAFFVHASIRGVTPWPGAKVTLERHDNSKNSLPGIDLLLEEGQLTNGIELAENTLTGTVLGIKDNMLLIACLDAPYAITKMRPAGGKTISAADFANGYLKGITACILPPVTAKPAG